MPGRPSGQGSGPPHQVNPFSPGLFDGPHPILQTGELRLPRRGSRLRRLGGLGLLTGRLHHAGPEAGLLVQRVVVGAAQLVDMHAGRRAHAAVVADEHVEILQTGRGAEHLSPLSPSALVPFAPPPRLPTFSE